ncbi:hypothetical protein [Haloferax sp. ATB1]|uniref:hypothetical protein n=1 Tax=Haloferax sp. ATB1 TaxID=1508454 RepID=UPI0012FEF5D6|nr:hypothetical protein [Haloferax sp. ATB1]
MTASFRESSFIVECHASSMSPFPVSLSAGTEPTSRSTWGSESLHRPPSIMSLP